MIFSEYKNPESKDYDIISSLSNASDSNNVSAYREELINLIGILEDVDDELLMEQYGISVQEYLSPNAITIEKVKQRLQAQTIGKQK